MLKHHFFPEKHASKHIFAYLPTPAAYYMALRNVHVLLVQTKSSNSINRWLPSTGTFVSSMQLKQ
jgi:hypothetical protein